MISCVWYWNFHSKQVLQFNNEESRYRFVKKLNKLLKSKGKNLKKHEETESNVYQRAVTKEKRQEMLSNFFKKVFAEVLHGNIILIPNVSLIFNWDFQTTLIRTNLLFQGVQCSWTGTQLQRRDFRSCRYGWLSTEQGKVHIYVILCKFILSLGNQELS